MIATTAFGLGVDVSDIASVILYGCPPDGLTYRQLSGSGGRNNDFICKCVLLYSPGELKDVDHFMQTACSEEVCLRDLLVRSVLESSEDLDANPDECCSVCANGTVPTVYVTIASGVHTSSRQPPKQAARRSRVTAQQKATLRKELLMLRSGLAECQYFMRGQSAVIPLQLVNGIVKNSLHIRSVNDLLLLGLSGTAAQKNFELLNGVASVGGIRPATVQPLCDVSNTI